MPTLIYKRTHSGDPDPITGEFGNRDCMGSVRGQSFSAVIGVGGIGVRPERHRIAGKLTWVGIGPHNKGDPNRALVTFDHFLYYVNGPLLKTLAPALARHIYGGKIRRILDSSGPAKEGLEIEKILATGMAAPPSRGRLKGAPRQRLPKQNGRCRWGLR